MVSHQGQGYEDNIVYHLEKWKPRDKQVTQTQHDGKEEQKKPLIVTGETELGTWRRQLESGLQGWFPYGNKGVFPLRWER